MKALFAKISIAGGIGAIGLVIALEIFGIGTTGLGPQQIILLLFGVFALGSGLVLHLSHTHEAQFVPVPLSQLLLMAAWFGLITGVLEVLVLGFQKFVQEKFIFLSPDVVWMAPFADMILFLGIALLLYLLSKTDSGFVSGQVLHFVFLFLAFLSLLIMFPKLHILASIVLAVGLSYQLSRMMMRRSQRFGKMVLKSVPWIAAVVLLIGLSIHGLRLMSESRAIASLPESTDKRPNVLLIVLDTVRAENLSVYGYERQTTPFLEKFSRRGVVFEHPVATSPWTLPTHASLFTGLFHHQLSVNWFEPLNDEPTTLSEALRDHGYVTAGFVANYNYCGDESGLQRGFIHYESYPVSAGQIVLSSSLFRSVINSTVFRQMLDWHDNLNRKFGDQISSDFLDWLDSKEKRPFFAFLNYYDAHQPYFPPAPFDEKFGPDEPRGNFKYRLNLVEINNWKNLNPEQIQVECNAYDGAIAYLDHQLEMLMTELDQRGILDNTIVIITSDHGEHLGEHGLYSHGNSLYLPLIKVPLLIVSPLVPQGERVEPPVSLRDLPRTIMHLTDLEAEQRLPGNSLTDTWQSARATDTNDKSILLSEITVLGGPYKGMMRSLIEGEYHYVSKKADEEELYNFVEDPQEMMNLSDNKEQQDRLTQFRVRLKELAVTSSEKTSMEQGKNKASGD